MACQPEQQVAVDAVMQESAPVLAEANLLHPIADLRHCPAADLIAHLVLDALMQPLLGCGTLQ